jgi:hypothetical protein
MMNPTPKTYHAVQGEASTRSVTGSRVGDWGSASASGSWAATAAFAVFAAGAFVKNRLVFYV